MPEAANATTPTVLPSCAYEKPQSQFPDPETYAAENVSSEITKSEKVTTSNDKSDSVNATVKRKNPLKQRVSSAPKKCPYCAYETAVPSRMKSHIKQHKNDKPITQKEPETCPFCRNFRTRFGHRRKYFLLHIFLENIHVLGSLFYSVR